MGCSPWSRKELGMTEQLTLTLVKDGKIKTFAFCSLSRYLLLLLLIIKGLKNKVEGKKKPIIFNEIGKHTSINCKIGSRFTKQ